ncbi:hypothetical protein BU16DRAFT_604844 [Lophium mytilinum]|uniref:Uncharacterized protein n=1 Tax=Lophium mytilinum TaxID=390894 RepID=A0A6A6R546_9PEZI|nr:hypothetical protein BU16DRAFT_604844 [Lophium mytilinum]
MAIAAKWSRVSRIGNVGCCAAAAALLYGCCRGSSSECGRRDSIAAGSRHCDDVSARRGAAENRARLKTAGTLAHWHTGTLAHWRQSEAREGPLCPLSTLPRPSTSLSKLTASRQPLYALHPLHQAASALHSPQGMDNPIVLLPQY